MMTALLNQRQQLAATMERELDALECCWVVSPLPLDDSKHLRVQIADVARNEVVQKIRDWGYEPKFVSLLPRVHPIFGMQGACVYEIDLPRERQAIPDDRIYGELAERKKKSAQSQFSLSRY